GFAVALGGGEQVPVAHVGDARRPGLVDLAASFPAAETLDDRPNAFEALLGIVSADEVTGRGAKIVAELADLLVHRRLGNELDHATRVVVDGAQRLVDGFDTASDRLGLPPEPLVEAGEILDRLRVQLPLELGLEPGKV